MMEGGTAKRPDEIALWTRVLGGDSPRWASHDLGIPEKRVVYLCKKWTALGFYDYGVSADLGWVTPKGVAQG